MAARPSSQRASVALPPVAWSDAESVMQLAADPVTVAMLATKVFVASAVGRITAAQAAAAAGAPLQQPDTADDQKRLEALVGFAIKRLFQLSTAGSPLEDGSVMPFEAIPGVAADAAAAVQWDLLTGGVDVQALAEEEAAKGWAIGPVRALQRTLHGFFASSLLLAATLHPSVFDSTSAGAGGGVLPAEITEASNALALEASIKCSALCEAARAAYSALASTSSSSSPSAKDQEDVALLFKMLQCAADGIATTLCGAISKTSSSSSITCRFTSAVHAARQKLASAAAKAGGDIDGAGEGAAVNSTVLKSLLSKRDASFASLEAAAASLNAAKALAFPSSSSTTAAKSEEGEEDAIGVLIATASRLSLGAHGAAGAAAKAAEATQRRRLDEVKGEVSKATMPLQEALKDGQSKQKAYAHRREQLLRELEELDNKARETDKEVASLSRQIEDVSSRFKPRLQQIEAQLGLSGKVLRLQEAAETAERTIHELRAAATEASMKPLISSAAKASSGVSAPASPVAAVSAVALRTLAKALALHSHMEASLLQALVKRREGVLTEVQSLTAEAAKYRAVALSHLADQQDKRIQALMQDVEQDNASIAHVKASAFGSLGDMAKAIAGFLHALSGGAAAAGSGGAVPALGRPSLASVAGMTTTTTSAGTSTSAAAGALAVSPLSGEDLASLAYLVGETCSSCQAIVGSGQLHAGGNVDGAAVAEELRRLHQQLSLAAQRKGESIPAQGSLDLGKELAATALMPTTSSPSPSTAAATATSATTMAMAGASTSSTWKTASPVPKAAPAASSAAAPAGAAAAAPSSSPDASGGSAKKKNKTTAGGGGALAHLLTASALKVGQDAAAVTRSLAAPTAVPSSSSSSSSAPLAFKLPAPPVSLDVPAAAAAAAPSPVAASRKKAPGSATASPAAPSAASGAAPGSNPWKKKASAASTPAE